MFSYVIVYDYFNIKESASFFVQSYRCHLLDLECNYSNRTKQFIFSQRSCGGVPKLVKVFKNSLKHECSCLGLPIESTFK